MQTENTELTEYMEDDRRWSVAENKDPQIEVNVRNEPLKGSCRFLLLLLHFLVI